jgi:hypothetical protein
MACQINISNPPHHTSYPLKIRYANSQREGVGLGEEKSLSKRNYNPVSPDMINKHNNLVFLFLKFMPVA